MSKYQHGPDVAVPPGETIKELAGNRGVTITQFMWGLGLSLQDAASLLQGDYPIDEEIADKLSILFEGYPSSFWLKLEEEYRKKVPYPWENWNVRICGADGCSDAKEGGE